MKSNVVHSLEIIAGQSHTILVSGVERGGKKIFFVVSQVKCLKLMSNCRDARLHEVGLVFGWVLVASLLIPRLLVVGALKSERNR